LGDKVEIAFRRTALELYADGSPGLLAVSGGGDSIALLHLMLRLALRRGLRLTVAHLDHGLRRGSRTDRAFVEKRCVELGLPCISDRIEVRRELRRDESPEEGARRVRRDFLRTASDACGANWVATGHTMDDQAETILMRLVRGAGATALTGMRERGPGRWSKPLLRLSRDELRGWLGARSIRFRDDPSNRDTRFDRNRVRRLVVPLLSETLNPQAARHLVQAADRLREDALYLDELAESSLRSASRSRGAGRLSIDAAELAHAPAVLAQRMARIALQRAGVDPRRIVARHITALLELVRDRTRRELHLPGRIRAWRRGDRIHLAPRE